MERAQNFCALWTHIFPPISTCSPTRKPSKPCPFEFLWRLHYNKTKKITFQMGERETLQHHLYATVRYIMVKNVSDVKSTSRNLENPVKLSGFQHRFSPWPTSLNCVFFGPYLLPFHFSFSSMNLLLFHSFPATGKTKDLHTECTGKVPFRHFS